MFVPGGAAAPTRFDRKCCLSARGVLGDSNERCQSALTKHQMNSFSSSSSSFFLFPPLSQIQTAKAAWCTVTFTGKLVPKKYCNNSPSFML